MINIAAVNCDLIPPKAAISVLNTTDGQSVSILRQNNKWWTEIISKNGNLYLPLSLELVKKILVNTFAQNDRPLEIERRWEVSIPKNILETVKPITIQQWYLLVGQNELGDNIEVRLRQKEEALILTIKQGQGLIRSEIEGPIDLKSMKDLNLVCYPTLTKRRFSSASTLGDQNLPIVEYNEFIGLPTPINTAEIEFGSVGSAKLFTPPICFGQEVTNNRHFDSCNLARLSNSDGL